MAVSGARCQSSPHGSPRVAICTRLRENSRALADLETNKRMKDYFSSIFGKSPVAPLESHADICRQCASQLIPLFDGVIAEDWDAVRKCRDRISALENEADAIKHQIRSNLPKSLFMPVSRQDLLELLLVQDKMANRSKDVSGLVVGRKMRIPKEVAEDFRRYVKRNIDAVVQAHTSVKELDELVETGFRGAEVRLVQSMIDTLDKIETDTDRLQSSIRNQLFEVESDYLPIDMVFLYQVIGLIGEVGDMAERTGRRLELMLAS